MNVRPLLPMLLMLFCCLSTAMASAGDFESPRRIADAAIAAQDLGQGGEATVDPGLRLARCPKPLTARVVRAGTVEVACTSPDWKVFVPVQVRNLRQVLVMRRAVAAGQTLTSADVELVQRDLGRIAQGVLVDTAQVVGRVARRQLQVGNLLATTDLQAEKIIRRGDVVDLVARRGTVEIRVSARASKDAAVGDSLLVENLSSRKTVQGTVAEDGTVNIK